MSQCCDQLAIAGVLGGLGDIGICAGQVGLEDVFLAVRGRENDDRDHAQEGIFFDLGQNLAAVESR